MSNGGSYDPHTIEPEIYKFWQDGGYFHAVPDPERKPYVIDIPLPNVTGSLHMGHALNNTIQDVLIRHARMLGYNAMWMPGTDHAGIATQAVVEKRLKEQENLTRHELGREGLVERIWKWKEEYGGRILEQLRRIGCSCDWERTRFTLDEICAKAVYEVFFQWFKAGLIYRGLRLVNWDAHLQTAVADDEIVHETVQGHLWQYRYPVLESHGATEPRSHEGVAAGAPLDDAAVNAAIARATAADAKLGVDYLSIATTRPETMLGDTALAVHPSDERYKHLIGKCVLLPLMNRAIPVIADGILVKQEFGTACVKVTPAHDPNDYACAQRNNLEMINILTPDGHINDAGGAYAGMTAVDARKKVVEDIESLGLMEKIEPYQHEVGHSDRSKTPIEPMLSEQWFVKMEDLAEMAMEAVRDGRVKFFPERYAKTYLDWLGEKRDWCISRQLWWGHRIPVWSRVVQVPDEIDEFLTDGLEHVLDESHGYARFGANERNFLVRVIRVTDQALIPDPKRVLVSRKRENAGQYAVQVCYVGGRSEVERGLEEGKFTRDSDVLDTWFSSAIWPFSTLGWPDDYGRRRSDEATKRRSEDSGAEPSVATDLDYFYPTTVLVTAREIITLWVARMVMTGLYFMKEVPFAHVHIHPNIQDGQGRRMSKSAGNGVDPVDLIDLYGTDAMRFTLTQMATETQDMRMPVSYLCPHCETLIPQDSVVPKNKVPAQVQKVTCKSCKKLFATVWASPELKKDLGVARDTSDRFELGRNFCNKLWQAATGFVLPNLTPCGTGFQPVNHRQDAGATPSGAARPRALEPTDLAVEDHWILSRLSACIAEVDRRYARYQLNEAANAIYAFFWSEFCDWYVELVKPRLFSRNDPGETVRHDDDSSQVARQVLAWVLDQTLRLLHPMMPFVTEALWQKLNEEVPRRGIASVCSVAPPRSTGTSDTISSALITAAWPDATAWKREAGVERDMQALQDVIKSLREIRNHVNGIRSAAKESAIRTLPRAVIKAEADLAETLRGRVAMLHRLGQCDELEIGPDVAKPPESASKVLRGVEVYVPLTGLADLDIERERLKKERDELSGHIRRIEGKLGNEGFVAKAPTEVVERERARLAELREKADAVARNLAEVGG